MPDEQNISSDETVDEIEDLTNFPKEINTYDPVPLSKETDEEKGSIKHIIKSIYSFIAIAAVFLAVIFSSAEICDFIFNDMGTGNIIMKRIFNKDLMGQGLSLCELIVKNSFVVPDSPATEAPPIVESTPPESAPSETPLMPTPSETEQPSPPPSLPDTPGENEFPILPMDMSLLSYGKYYIYNNTELSPNISSLASASLPSYYVSDAPLVLVIHTHGTESYMPEGAKYYVDDGEIARSQNTSENMIAVGVEFVRVLEENGIPTLHCTIMHDKESYRDSYSRAAESIKEYLKAYPSIKYVFDLHRDSLMRPTGELVSAVTSINGESCAQVMPVVGSGFVGWEANMTFALRLRDKLNREFINLCRPACLRASTYNQNMSPISLLIEIGTSGNTLTEAKNAASLTAKAISEIIKAQ